MHRAAAFWNYKISTQKKKSRELHHPHQFENRLLTLNSSCFLFLSAPSFFSRITVQICGGFVHICPFPYTSLRTLGVPIGLSLLSNSLRAHQWCAQACRTGTNARCCTYTVFVLLLLWLCSLRKGARHERRRSFTSLDERPGTREKPAAATRGTGPGGARRALVPSVVASGYLFCVAAVP